MNCAYLRLFLWAGLVACSAHAQVTGKKVLTLEGAERVIAAAEAEAKKNNVGCSIAVVDDGGNLLAFHRLDGTFPAGASISIGKAKTAAIFQKPTKVFEEAIAKGRTSMIALSNFTPLQGGVPIIVDGQVIGAVGVSGAFSAQQDEEFAEAGAAALKQIVTR
jgi:glc operon protein GlcG